MAISAETDLEIFQLDVVLAYSNVGLQKTKYMEQPEVFVENGKENLVCCLKKF